MNDEHRSSLVDNLTAPHEPNKELDRLAHGVIGAALEVHRELGPGLKNGIKRVIMS